MLKNCVYLMLRLRSLVALINLTSLFRIFKILSILLHLLVLPLVFFSRMRLLQKANTFWHRVKQDGIK